MTFRCPWDPPEAIENREMNDSPKLGLGTGIYVDVENLGNEGARGFIDSLLGDWPASTPQPSKLNLYVRGDTTALWRMRFLSNKQEISVSVKGIQHFDSQGSKNSADIAIAVDAIADFTQGCVRHIAIFSDDSDYISLFDKLIELTNDDSPTTGRAPFLWILTNRFSNKSPRINEFIPSEYLHYIGDSPSDSTAETAGSRSDKRVSAPRSSKVQSNQKIEDIANYLIQKLPVGKFKSTDCKRIVKDRFANHSMASMNDAAFGSQFSKSIWPLLEQRGVRLTKVKSPRTYELTQETKDPISPA